MPIDLIDEVDIAGRLAAFVAQGMLDAGRNDHQHRAYRAQTNDVTLLARRRVVSSVPQSELDHPTNANQMVGLLAMPVPVGNSVGVQLHPVYLLRRDADSRPVSSEQLHHPAAFCKDIAKFQDFDARDSRGSGSSAATGHGLTVFNSGYDGRPGFLKGSLHAGAKT
jgi:hypothetical protein